jgi:steroid 5-alpha reductase family enzyme
MFSDKKLETLAPLGIRIMFIVGFIFAGIGAMGRLWCSQYIAGYKDVVLVMDGPYSISRNPLYLFSFIGGCGVGLCTGSLFLTLIILIGFAIIYPITINNEEKKLSEKFAGVFNEYMTIVPCFFPKFSLYREPQEYLIKPRIFRKVIIDSMYFIWFVLLFNVLELLKDFGVIKPLFSIY